MLNQFIKRFYRLLIALYKINIFKAFTSYDRSSNNIIWIRDNSFKYLFSTSFLWDVATIRALIEKGYSYKIVLGLNIGNSFSKYIFYTLHPRYGVYGFSDYTSDLHYVIGKLSENNKLFPNLNEVLLWENKAYMHRIFDAKNIPAPKTNILTLHKIDFDSLKFPFLLKEVHSCESNGIYKIENLNDLNIYINSLEEEQLSNEVLFQEILNIRKDLRVVVIGNKIVHYYWRINLSDDWRPTATSKGNKVDFSNFPKQHYDQIVSFAQRLNLTAAAFDVAWQNDDLSTDPIILEVSPAFSPNPKTTVENELLNYGRYKKNISFKGYDYQYVHLIFEIKIEHFLVSDL